MKTFIILTEIGAYLALGILITSLICKITDADIDSGSAVDVIGIGVCVIFWPLFLIAVIVVEQISLFFKGLSYGVKLILKAFNNNN